MAAKCYTQTEYNALIAALPKGPPRGPYLKSNAACNRDAAIKAHKAGRTAAEIAEYWPEVWCLVDGKLAQIYTYRFRDRRDEYETDHLITGASVAALCRRKETRS